MAHRLSREPAIVIASYPDLISNVNACLRYIRALFGLLMSINQLALMPLANVYMYILHKAQGKLPKSRECNHTLHGQLQLSKHLHLCKVKEEEH